MGTKIVLCNFLNLFTAVILTISAGILAALNAHAELIKYTDSEERIHYVDSLSKVPEQYRASIAAESSFPPVTKYENRSENLGWQASARPPTYTARPGTPVTIYVTSWCPHCIQLEKFLVENKVKFRKRDIEKDQHSQSEYKRLGGNGVPFIRVGEKSFQGFSPGPLSAALGIGLN